VELLVLAALAAAVVAVAVARRRRQDRSATVSVTADADGVRRTLADGRVEEVSWAEVVEVDVFTTRVGPHKASGGAVVLYGDAERGCIVPLDQLAGSGLLDHAHRLVGFDPAKVVAAVAGPEDPATGARAAFAPRPLQQTTVCWKREET
jgi:hypothetical protein